MYVIQDYSLLARQAIRFILASIAILEACREPANREIVFPSRVPEKHTHPRTIAVKSIETAKPWNLALLHSTF